MVIWIAAVLMITAVALFVAAPLSDHSTRTEADAESYDHEHALAVQGLRELEFDHAMGKLDGDDYRALRKKLEIRALATAVSPNRTALAAMPERRVEIVPSSTLARAAAENLCVQCGARFDQAHHFCPNCGAARAIQASV
ncbi:MAG: c-type cytochrome biogenesis protein CcmI [Deltaproteobacteria bacterium]|nr:c-type cytochrome biogenesis protein CcmI [Deltaproteobacteria bacterium]